MGLYQRGVLFKLLFGACLVFALSACSLYSEDAYMEQGEFPPPSLEKIKPPATAVAAPPSPIETLRALSPPEGFKFTPLFNEPVRDSAVRLRRTGRGRP